MRALRSLVLLGCIGLGLTSGAFAGATASVRFPTFSAPKYFKLGTTEPKSLTAADLNGDGKIDLVTAKPGSGTVAVVLGNGDGTFRPKHEYETGLDPSVVAIGDLDEDGRPDLATANLGAGGYLSVLRGNGDGTFDQAGRVDYRTGGASLAIGDLNGDGRLDLVTSSDPEDAAGSVSVLLNRGDGTFMGPAEYAAGVGPISATIADLNRDAHLDVVVANAGASHLSVYLNRGDGELSPRVDYKTGKEPVAIASKDLNADGVPDLVTTNGAYGKETVSVLLNRGDGTFGGKRDYGIDAEGGLAVGDLNGDGSPDIATVFRENVGSLVFVLFNGGKGGFPVHNWLEYGTKNPAAVVIADLNRDGRQDLATVSIRPPGFPISVLLNRPGLCNVQYVLKIPLWLAKKWLVRGGCRVGRVRRVFEAYVKKGRVISQSPDFGTVRSRGRKVTLVISRGRKR
jgi:hypothetical protein